VVDLSPTVAGQTPDKKAADAAQMVYPPNATLGKDTGFQGYEPAGVLAQQPPKKPRGQELSVEDKFFNSLISSTRVVVENVLAGVKRCRIVKDVLRLTAEGMSDLVMEIACGLHNLRVSCRHPFPTFDVRSLLSSG
jgi:DDE superfamily endonuclease